MKPRQHRYFCSGLVNNLERLTTAQQLLTMALAETVEFTMNWNCGNSYISTSGVLNSTGSSSTGLSKRQRYRRNKKLKRLQQKETPISVPKTALVSKPNMESNKDVPINVSTAPAQNNVLKSTKETSNVKLRTMTISVSKNEGNRSLEKVPGLSNMLYELATEFHTEIRNMQKVFDANCKDDSPMTLDQQPTVAEITLVYGCPMTSQVLQLIRSVILDSINKLQKSKKPVFYCMTNKGTYVSILCQDEYAYKFLEDCFACTSTLSVHRLKSRFDRLYCCTAIYMGIINDVKEFLLQIRLHIPKMHTEHWIVASNKVVRDAENNETQLLFLVDELSALMLEHQYGNRLLINLSEVFFHNHGELPNFKCDYVS